MNLWYTFAELIHLALTYLSLSHLNLTHSSRSHLFSEKRKKLKLICFTLRFEFPLFHCQRRLPVNQSLNKILQCLVRRTLDSDLFFWQLDQRIAEILMNAIKSALCFWKREGARFAFWIRFRFNWNRSWQWSQLYYQSPPIVFGGSNWSLDS